MVFMTLLWVMVILTILLILVAIRIYYIPFIDIEKDVDPGEIVDVEYFIKNAKNGDLIFLSGDTFGEKSIRWCHKSYWSHCAIIFIDYDDKKEKLIPYVFESDLGQGHIDGPRVTPLENKLKRWRGHKTLAWKRYEGSEIKKEDILALATKYYVEKYTFDRTMYSWFFSGFPDSWMYKKVKPEKSLFCSELLAELLQNIGLLEKTHVPGWYTPEYFYGERFKPLKGGYRAMKYINFNFFV